MRSCFLIRYLSAPLCSRIDKVMEEFGLPMGPFRLLDLVGLDIGLAIGKIYNMAYADRSRTGPVLGKMIDNGWKGQKTGHGYYSYDKKLRGVGQPDAAALSKFIPSVLKKETNVSDEDIVDMILLPCVNEACRLLAEGVAAKSSDVDIGSIMGKHLLAEKSILYTQFTLQDLSNIL